MGTIYFKLLLIVAPIFVIARITSNNITTDANVGDCKCASREDRLLLSVTEPIKESFSELGGNVQEMFLAQMIVSILFIARSYIKFFYSSCTTPICFGLSSQKAFKVFSPKIGWSKRELFTTETIEKFNT